MWYFVADMRQSTFLCNILVPLSDFDKSQPTFKAVQRKAGLTLLGELGGNQEKYIILHIGEHQVRCYLIVVWRRGASGQNVPEHTFVDTLAWEWKGSLKYESPYIQIKPDGHSLLT